MRADFVLPKKLAEQIEWTLVDLRCQTEAECVLLATISGQLISAQGGVQEIDSVLMAALAAADVMATAELSRLIGGKDSGGAMLREGRHRNVYLFDIASRFVLIVVFRASTLAALVHLFGRRAVERLHPLAVEFETWMNKPAQVSDARFGAALAEELDKTFEGL